MKSNEKIPGSLFVLSFAIIVISSLMSLHESNSKSVASRGAESAKQLSNVLFHAIRLNNFQQLSYYVPSQEELTMLKKYSNEKNKLFFESLHVADIHANVQMGFERITREGIDKNINWSTAELIDYATKSCNLNIDGCNVTYTIEDQNLNKIVVTYDAIKANDKWFLFQNLNLGNSAEEVSIK